MRIFELRNRIRIFGSNTNIRISVDILTIYGKERSFRERNVPFAKGTFFIRKEGFIQLFQAHWSKFGTERLKIFSHKSCIMYKKTFEAV